MSYFTTKQCNDWIFKDALQYFLDSAENEKEAKKRMGKRLLEILADVNCRLFMKKKAEAFLLKLSPATSSLSSPQNSSTYNNFNMSNINGNINNFNMSNINGNINNVINNNGKRVNDIFNTQDDIGIDRFTKKLLSTANTSQVDREEEEEKEDEEKEDEEEKEQLQMNITFPEEGHVDVYSRLNNLIKAWKKNQIYEPLIHKQQLLYYNIIDISLDTSPITKEDLDFISKTDYCTYISSTHADNFDINLTNCNSFISLKTIYEENNHTMPYTIKKMIKVYLNQRYEEHVNLFIDYSQTEDDYKLHFIAPLFKALFKQNENIKKAWGESFVGNTKVDGLLSILDEEGIIAIFSVVEVSGPWSVVSNNHFKKDRNKLAKNLKLMLNRIYKCNVFAGSNITKIKLYGIQVYLKCFYVYSIQMICPKLYLFKEEHRFDYPTSPVLFRSQLPIFFKNMLILKQCIESSLENILMFINDTDVGCSDEKYIDNTDNSPQKKK